MLSALSAINMENLIKALNIFWQGLLAVVIVVGVIILTTCVLKFVFRERQKKSEDGTDSRTEEER